MSMPSGFQVETTDYAGAVATVVAALVGSVAGDAVVAGVGVVGGAADAVAVATVRIAASAVAGAGTHARYAL